MRTLTILLIAVLGMAITSCSDDNNTTELSTSTNIVRGKIISRDSQIVPVILSVTDLDVYKIGDTVALYKSSSSTLYSINTALIDSNSVIAVIERGND